MAERIVTWDELHPPMSAEEVAELNQKIEERRAWEEGRLRVDAPNSAYQV